MTLSFDGVVSEMEGLWDAESVSMVSDVACNSSISSRDEVILSPYYQHSLAVAAVFTLAYLFIFLLCVTGNALVCVIVLKNRNMRTVTNIFILNLSISDLLVGIFCIPTTLVDNLITGWPFSNTVCKVSGLVQGTSVCASVFTLVAIAVDRFRCIVHPFKAKLTLFVAKVSVGMIWLLALTIMFPSVLMLTVEQDRGHFTVGDDNGNRTYPLYSCYETWPDPEMRKVYTTVLFVHIYLVPLALIMLLYGRIGLKLYHTAVLTASEPSPNKCSTSPRRIRVIKMLMMVALMFLLSWLPLWTLMLLTDYSRPDGDTLELLTGFIFPLSHWLAFSNSAVNPVIYGYFNENFRRGYQAACRRRAFCWRERRTGFSITHPVSLNTRKRIFTDTDLTRCVCLELKHRTVSTEGGTSIRQELHYEDLERVSSSAGGRCQAREL